MKIGVIADTHIPDGQARLPAGLTRAFAGLDIILHAGDVCNLDTLRQLQNTFTITMAVAGEHDDAEVQRFLEAQRVVQFGDTRIGLLHGHQGEPTGWLRRLLPLSPTRQEAAVCQAALVAFQEVSCVVFGHTHRPYVKMHGSILLFNPGPAAPIAGQRPSVGLLEIDKRSIMGRIVYLDEV
jgi:putative phosphoesterase